MGKRLPDVRVHNQDRGDFKVEKCAGYTTDAVLDVHTLGAVALPAVCEVALKLGGAVLVGVDLVVACQYCCCYKSQQGYIQSFRPVSGIGWIRP
jgi:hypothetical protein